MPSAGAGEELPNGLPGRLRLRRVFLKKLFRHLVGCQLIEEKAMHYRNVFIFGLLAALLCFPVVFAADRLSLVVPGKTIELSSDDWTKARDKRSFAKNYEEKRISPWHKYGRMVTVFLIPMSDDRRVGLKISDREYVEFFIVHPGLITVQTRVDKGRYWVLCRETFNQKSHLPVDASAYKPFLSENENQLLWRLYQAEIDETRYLLQSTF